MSSPHQNAEEKARERRDRRLRKWCIIALSTYAFLWIAEWRPILWLFALWFAVAAIFGFLVRRGQQQDSGRW